MARLRRYHPESPECNTRSSSKWYKIPFKGYEEPPKPPDAAANEATRADAATHGTEWWCNACYVHYNVHIKGNWPSHRRQARSPQGEEQSAPDAGAGSGCGGQPGAAKRVHRELAALLATRSCALRAPSPGWDGDGPATRARRRLPPQHPGAAAPLPHQQQASSQGESADGSDTDARTFRSGSGSDSDGDKDSDSGMSAGGGGGQASGRRGGVAVGGQDVHQRVGGYDGADDRGGSEDSSSGGVSTSADDSDSDSGERGARGGGGGGGGEGGGGAARRCAECGGVHTTGCWYRHKRLRETPPLYTCKACYDTYRRTGSYTAGRGFPGRNNNAAEATGGCGGGGRAAPGDAEAEAPPHQQQLPMSFPPSVTPRNASGGAAAPPRDAPPVAGQPGELVGTATAAMQDLEAAPWAENLPSPPSRLPPSQTQAGTDPRQVNGGAEGVAVVAGTPPPSADARKRPCEQCTSPAAPPRPVARARTGLARPAAQPPPPSAPQPMRMPEAPRQQQNSHQGPEPCQLRQDHHQPEHEPGQDGRQGASQFCLRAAADAAPPRSPSRQSAEEEAHVCAWCRIASSQAAGGWRQDAMHPELWVCGRCHAERASMFDNPAGVARAGSDLPTGDGTAPMLLRPPAAKQHGLHGPHGGESQANARRSDTAPVTPHGHESPPPPPIPPTVQPALSPRELSPPPQAGETPQALSSLQLDLEPLPSQDSDCQATNGEAAAPGLQRPTATVRGGKRLSTVAEDEAVAAVAAATAAAADAAAAEAASAAAAAGVAEADVAAEEAEREATAEAAARPDQEVPATIGDAEPATAKHAPQAAAGGRQAGGGSCGAAHVGGPCNGAGEPLATAPVAEPSSGQYESSQAAATGGAAQAARDEAPPLGALRQQPLAARQGAASTDARQQQHAGAGRDGGGAAKPGNVPSPEVIELLSSDDEGLEEQEEEQDGGFVSVDAPRAAKRAATGPAGTPPSALPEGRDGGRRFAKLSDRATGMADMVRGILGLMRQVPLSGDERRGMQRALRQLKATHNDGFLETSYITLCDAVHNEDEAGIREAFHDIRAEAARAASSRERQGDPSPVGPSQTGGAAKRDDHGDEPDGRPRVKRQRVPL